MIRQHSGQPAAAESANFLASLQCTMPRGVEFPKVYIHHGGTSSSWVSKFGRVTLPQSGQSDIVSHLMLKLGQRPRVFRQASRRTEYSCADLLSVCIRVVQGHHQRRGRRKVSEEAFRRRQEIGRVGAEAGTVVPVHS